MCRRQLGSFVLSSRPAPGRLHLLDDWRRKARFHRCASGAPGASIHLADGLRYATGSLTAGRKLSEVFIENGRFDGEKIFGDRATRTWANQLYAATRREVGE